MGLHRTVAVLRARVRAIAVVALAAAGLAATLDGLAPKSYRAVAVIAVAAPADVRDAGHGERAGPATARAALFRSEPVARGAARRLGLENERAWHARWLQDSWGGGDYPAWAAERLARGLVVDATPGAGTLTVAYTDADPRFAAAAANAFVRAGLDAAREIAARHDDAPGGTRAEANDGDEGTAAAGFGSTGLEIVRPATAPAAPIDADPLPLAALAFVLGGLAAAALALAAEGFDRRLRIEDDVARTLGQPLLASIPSRPRASAWWRRLRPIGTAARRPDRPA